MARTLNKSAYLDRLAAVPLFRALSKKDLQRLARNADRATIPAGREVTREGETGYEFFVIAEGRATVKRRNRKVASLKAGDYFGELALLDNVPRNATVVADTEMQVFVLDRRQFSAVLREVPEMAVKLLRGLAHRLSEADAKILH